MHKRRHSLGHLQYKRWYLTVMRHKRTAASGASSPLQDASAKVGSPPPNRAVQKSTLLTAFPELVRSNAHVLQKLGAKNS